MIVQAREGTVVGHHQNSGMAVEDVRGSVVLTNYQGGGNGDFLLVELAPGGDHPTGRLVAVSLSAVSGIQL